MFVHAIEIATGFTRPIHSISRNYGSSTIHLGTATLFFINSDGWALTCRHVAEQLLAGDQLLSKREAFLKELDTRHGQKKEKQLVRELEQKYGYSKNVTFELYNTFINCVEGPLNVEIRSHSNLDLALIHFREFIGLGCNSFPTFAANGSDLKQGKFLCRLGFPFPEFSNFAYDSTTNKIQWTTSGRTDTPCFPIEGMVTRHLVEGNGPVIGFEMSTPGLRGQSGGPAFDPEGRIWGMQAATAHLDLDFDVNQEVMRNGLKKRVSDSAFLHVGHCMHVNVLKSFMTQHGVRFQEG
jgi:Trypsin-like peptidase domain